MVRAYHVTDTITDNAPEHMDAKIALRLEAIRRLGEPRDVLVLDAYHGHGELWKAVQPELPEGWKVRIFAADKQRRSAGTLQINNARLLETLDLTRFDLIDLDAYGWPTAQLKLVAARAPGKMVVTTRISRAFGAMPHIITDDLGFDVRGFAPTLVVRLADELWESWLYQLGYRTSLLFRYDHLQICKRYELLLPAGAP